MSAPSKPALSYSYTAFQTSQGDNSFPGTQLDNDLDGLAKSVAEVIDFASAVVRPDGKLQNAVVTKASLDESVHLGLPAPRPWLTKKNYAVNDTATFGNNLYIALVDHVAGAVFTADLAVGRWALLAQFTVPVDINDESVTTAKIAGRAVTSAKLGEQGVEEINLAAGAVTRAKLSPGVGAALCPAGTELPFSGAVAPAGWIFPFGQLLSRAAFPALLNALAPAAAGVLQAGQSTVTSVNVDLRFLGLEGCLIEGPGIPAGTTVVSIAASSFVLSVAATQNVPSAVLRVFPHGNGDGGSTFNAPDGRGRVCVGRGNMGGVSAGRPADAGAGGGSINVDRLGAVQSGGNPARVVNYILFTGVV